MQSVQVFFPEQECNLVTASACMTKSSFIRHIILEKLCKVHMRVFEIVAPRNVDSWTK